MLQSRSRSSSQKVAGIPQTPSLAPSARNDQPEELLQSHSAECTLIFPLSGSHGERGHRPTMEDTHVTIDCVGSHPMYGIGKGKHVAFYAVFDGHGGQEAAKIAASTLHKSIILHDDFPEGDYKKAIFDGVKETDQTILKRSRMEGWRSGATAAVILIIDRTIYAANLGDTEIVLGRKIANGTFQPITLSLKHKPDDSSEKIRVQAAGGSVFLGRVQGVLAVSRAFGDPEFKVPLNDSTQDFVSSDPEISTFDLTDDDEFIVIACDGLWDVATYSEVVDFVAKRKPSFPPSAVSKDLVVDAIRNRRSQDNVSVVTVYLK